MQSYQISNLSDAQEQDFGQQIHNELTRSGQVKLYQNQRVVSYINEIGQRLARQSTRPNLNYKFFVVEDDSVNAFATMGGYNYINTGLIKTAANEAELASVIGHEIGHIAAKHSLEQMRMQAGTRGFWRRRAWIVIRLSNWGWRSPLIIPTVAVTKRKRMILGLIC